MGMRTWHVCALNMGVCALPCPTTHLAACCPGSSWRCGWRCGLEYCCRRCRCTYPPLQCRSTSWRCAPEHGLLTGVILGPVVDLFYCLRVLWRCCLRWALASVVGQEATPLLAALTRLPRSCAWHRLPAGN